MGKTPKLPAGFFFNLCLPAAGIIILVVSLGYGFGTLKKPGTGLYPFFLGLFIAIFGALLLISEWRARIRFPLLQRGDLRIFVSMIAAFCLWILLMPLFGYLAMTLLATFGFCKIMGLEGWRKPLSISIGTTLFIYLMFDYWLYIDLPRGLLG
jgi:putative tricarboxylic transport membrane protein